MELFVAIFYLLSLVHLRQDLLATVFKVFQSYIVFEYVTQLEKA